MHDVRARDRAQEAFNLARKEPVQQKTMVYIIPSKVKQGVVALEVRFPWKGVVSNIYASCGKKGATQTEFAIEKCTAESLDSDEPVWTNILTTNVTLDADVKSTNSSAVPFVIGDNDVQVNDHFRVNVLTVGDGIEDITLELVIDI